jgi:predicted ATPase
MTGSRRTALPRQQTLEASLAWSHALLTEPQRLVFRRLGVFPATFDLDAAIEICAAEGVETWQVLDLVTLLVDKNLVTVDDSGETARYRLLETIGLYAQDRLVAAGEDERIRMRHCDHYLALAEQAAPYLESPESAAWAERLTVEWPNLEAGLVCCRRADLSEELQRLVVALAALWMPGNASWPVPNPVGVEWVDAALGSGDPGNPTRRAELL